MIQNAVLHIANEQPLVVDLYEMPNAADVSLVCTNVRMLGGKKPVFIDHATSVFVFPYDTIRFVEIPGVGAGRRANRDDVGDSRAGRTRPPTMRTTPISSSTRTSSGGSARRKRDTDAGVASSPPGGRVAGLHRVGRAPPPRYAPVVIRFVVVDDHPPIGAALSAAVRERDDLELVGTPTTVGEAMTMITATRP